MKHYEFTRGHLKNLKGYDFYHRVAQHIERTGDDKSAAQFVDLMPYGTPEQVLEKIRFIQARTGCGGLLASMSYGGMPLAEAQRNLRLFAAEVLPQVKQMETAQPAFARSA